MYFSVLLYHTRKGLLTLNFKTILSEIPQGKDLRITNNGRIIKRADDQRSGFPKQSTGIKRSHPAHQIPHDVTTANGRNQYTPRTSPDVTYSAVLQGLDSSAHNRQSTSQGFEARGYKEPFQPQPPLVHQYTPQSQGIPTQVLVSSQTYQPPDQSESFIASGSTPSIQRQGQQLTQTVMPSNQSQLMLASGGIINHAGQNFWTQQNQGDYSVNHC